MLHLRRVPMKKILVAVDGSPPAVQAAHLGLKLARATGAELTLVYSVPPMDVGEVPFTVVNDVVKAEAQRGKQLLEHAVAQLETTNVKTVLLEGPPAMRIAELAEAEAFDMVVVGSRGRNAVARVFLGSVADRLVHLCKQPVLVVR